MKRLFLFIDILLLCVLSGCSNYIKITGQVKFVDGEPVNFGYVVFETPENSFTGALDAQGHYAIGVNKDGTGIPPNEYTVWLAGTASVKYTTIKKSKNDESDDETFDSEETPRVHSKYTSPHSADALKFEVKRGGEKTFDFTVERPNKPQNKSKR
ncbi:MAG: hypothetical protein LBC20_08515 [Planctomycetaceae bacterium]|jgi:hypothetical protein|nr:hypothetical protein [Planctomycetaceae bacterium]